MERSDYQKIFKIKEYCSEISQTIARYGASFDSYTLDIDYQKSLAFSILQIGELAGHLSEEYRRETSEMVQWSPIRGMRNVVAHGYGSIDHEMIWDTATIDIPALKKFCDKQIELYQQSYSTEIKFQKQNDIVF